MRSYFCFYGSRRIEIQAASLADARTQAVELIAGGFAPGLVPPLPDEIRVRPVRDDEMAGV